MMKKNNGIDVEALARSNSVAHRRISELEEQLKTTNETVVRETVSALSRTRCRIGDLETGQYKIDKFIDFGVIAFIVAFSILFIWNCMLTSMFFDLRKEVKGLASVTADIQEKAAISALPPSNDYWITVWQDQVLDFDARIKNLESHDNYMHTKLKALERWLDVIYVKETTEAGYISEHKIGIQQYSEPATTTK